MHQPVVHLMCKSRIRNLRAPAAIVWDIRSQLELFGEVLWTTMGRNAGLFQLFQRSAWAPRKRCQRGLAVTPASMLARTWTDVSCSRVSTLISDWSFVLPGVLKCCECAELLGRARWLFEFSVVRWLCLSPCKRLGLTLKASSSMTMFGPRLIA